MPRIASINNAVVAFFATIVAATAAATPAAPASAPQDGATTHAANSGAEGFLQALSFSPDGIVWQTDWWKILIIAFATLLFLFLLVKLTAYVFRMVGVIVCLAVGAAGGYTAMIAGKEMVAAHLPENAVPAAPFIAAAAGFLLCYFLAATVISILRRTATPPPQGKE